MKGCIGQSGKCCGTTANYTDADGMVVAGVVCSQFCIEEGKECCGCNIGATTNPDLACFGCPSGQCTPSMDERSKLEYYCETSVSSTVLVSVFMIIGAVLVGF